MAKLVYGSRSPYFRFTNNHDFFEVYGFLCNTRRHGLDFQWEYNEGSGAWGNEGRIHFYQTLSGSPYNPMPTVLHNRLTAGRGNIVNRVNCNDFINELVYNYGFSVNPSRPGNTMTRTAQGLIPPPNPENYVPEEYLPDYYRGYNM